MAAEQAPNGKQAECPNLRDEFKKRANIDPVDQKVSTTCPCAWVVPKSADQPNSCPSLKSLANHGYLPHNGVADVLTITSAENIIEFKSKFPVEEHLFHA